MECSRCILLRELCEVEEGDARTKSIEIHRNIDEWRTGMNESCWWCIRILQGLQQRMMPLDDIPAFRTEVYYHRNKYHLRAIVELGYGTSEASLSFQHFKSDSVVNLGSQTDSTQSWKYIEQRLAKCESSHASCRKRSDDLPTWLIKIDELRHSKARCHLVRSDDEGSIEKYVTMSHRWQPDTISDKKLIAAKLEEYQRCIPIEELPKHYSDAVVATYKLNIKYLWIDFLCIIQDGPSLSEELNKMTDIYHNAYCNLSAASAHDGCEGLFFERDFSKLPLVFQLKEGESSHFVMSSFGSPLDPDDSIFAELDSEPLYTRGWVCQERFLARRNMSFTKHLIFIECQSTFDCEMGSPSGDIKTLRGSGARFELQRITQIQSDHISTLYGLEEDDLLSFWSNIVGLYLRSDLTFPSDRLSAISGLARYIEMTTKDHYLAGLWKYKLPFQLCWYVQHAARRFGRSDLDEFTISGLAPSWSWANIDGFVDPIFWVHGIDVTLTSVVEICAASCEIPFGAKTTGCIDLCGWIMPIRQRDSKRIKPPRWGGNLQKSLGGYSLEMSLGMKCLTNESQRQRLTSPERTIELEWDTFQPNHMNLLQSCYALPVYFGLNRLKGLSLILTSTNEFRRVGTWSVGLEDFVETPSQDSGSNKVDWDERCTRVVPGDIVEYTEGKRETGNGDEAFIRAMSEPTIRTLRQIFGECDLNFLEKASGGRRFIKLV